MDRLAYIAMTGAQQILQQQAVAANNLAQAGTPGFKADSLAFRVVPVVGAAPGTRAYAVATTPGADMRPGPVEQTGRVLDVALDGNAMLAVQSRDGLEAYTRAGRLAISSDGSCERTEVSPCWAKAARSPYPKARAWRSPGTARSPPSSSRRAAPTCRCSAGSSS